MNAGAVATSLTTGMGEGVRSAPRDERLRANTYSLLGALLAAPPAESLIHLLTQITPVESGGDSDLTTAWEVLRLAGERATVESLDDEYHELFVGIGRGELVPYGSWYMTGFLMDQPLAVLRRDLAELGFERQEEIKEPEDHVATPYATVTFDDPKGEKFRYTKIVRSMPPAPTILNPHPYGVDVETIKRMVEDSKFSIPTVDNKTIEKVRTELGLKKKDLNYSEIMGRAKKRWSSLSRHVKVIIAVMSFLKMDFDKLSKIRIDDLEISSKKLSYWDFGESKSFTIDMDPESDYYRQLTNTTQGEMLGIFLTKRFQRVGRTTAEKFAEFAGFKPEKRIGTMTNQELVKLSDSLQKFPTFLSPDPKCLAPLGAEPLEKGMKAFFNPDFISVVQRGASAYSGFPFVVEMGIAYGGEIPSGGTKVYRFANRIPLLYDEGSDVVLKVVNETDWARYKVKGDPPLVIVSHICSTKIPYKTVGKENVADRPEIERELRLALQFLSRKLASYMSKRGQAEMEKKRANLYLKYIPLVAKFCTELSGKKKEPDYKKILKEAVPIETKT